MEARRPCPVDEHGIPLIPEGIGECYEVCMKGAMSQNRHHLSYPRVEHRDFPSRHYREAGSMVVKACVCKHADYHSTYLPPRKPSRQVMIDVAQGDLVPQEALVYIRERGVYED